MGIGGSRKFAMSVVGARAVAAQVAAGGGGSCLLQYASTSSYKRIRTGQRDVPTDRESRVEEL